MMNKKVRIVKDQFVEATNLRSMLEKAGYTVCGIARAVIITKEIIVKEYIFLIGKLNGFDCATDFYLVLQNKAGV